MKAPWPRLTMMEAINKLGSISLHSMSDSDVQLLLEQNGWDLEGDYNRGLATQLVFEKPVKISLFSRLL